MTNNQVKIVECPRDAMQGFSEFIPTEDKVRYINSLLKVGFDTLDFGSFVSSKAIPNLKDTDEVIQSLDWNSQSSHLLSIIGNAKGANRAVQYSNIQYLGFPFSISETFLQRNINSGIEDSKQRLLEVLEISKAHNRKVVAYISMAFGNPYNDEWSPDIVFKNVEWLASIGVDVISLSDTIACAEPQVIKELFSYIVPNFSDFEIGAHLHTTPYNWKANIEAAFEAGCRRFDGALLGYGGCPMAKDELTGNLPTENLIYYLNEIGVETPINKEALKVSMDIASEIFTSKKLHKTSFDGMV
jgi:hydroxymethylglutaryl-CoA lyase